MRCLFILLLSVQILLSACSSTEEINTDTAEGAYKLASVYEKDKRYEEAITQYSEVKNKFPYSQLATEAELKIADIYYERESYIESQSAYELFKEFHPQHPKSDYVTYRIGLSYEKQLPSTVDRDLSLAKNALLHFNEVEEAYPGSSFVPKAQESVKRLTKMLAKKVLYIADFYFKQSLYDSALGRYEDMLSSYSGVGLDARALFGAAVSAKRSGEEDKAKLYLSKLNKYYKGSKESVRAEKEMKK